MQINRTFAVFDFYGTITTSDSLRDFVRHTIGSARFAMGVLLALPSLVGMLIGICDRASAKARFLAVTIGGMTQRELEGAVQQYAARELRALIRPEMVTRIHEHKRRGHRLLLVSASPALYLKYVGRDYRFRCGSRDRVGTRERPLLRPPSLAKLLGTREGAPTTAMVWQRATARTLCVRG